jgi:hypothetical protein
MLDPVVQATYSRCSVASTLHRRTLQRVLRRRNKSPFGECGVARPFHDLQKLRRSA